MVKFVSLPLNFEVLNHFWMAGEHFFPVGLKVKITFWPFNIFYSMYLSEVLWKYFSLEEENYKFITTVSNGYLGSCNDEERSKLR